MTDSFKSRGKDSAISNAFREGWQAACNLHLRNGDAQGPTFGDAWLDSESFGLMTDDQKKDDFYLKQLRA